MGKTSGKISKSKHAKLLIAKRWNKSSDHNDTQCDIELDLDDIQTATNAAELPQPRNDEYMFIHKEVLKSMLNSVLCSECNEKNVVIEIRHKLGFSNQIVVKCNYCHYALSQIFSSPRLEPEEKKSFEINRW